MKQNVLYLLIDSFSAEKCHGKNKTSTTPTIDHLIDDGIYFSQTISAAPTTIPSLSSIFTGRYPFSCLTLDNDLFRLQEDIPTFIDIMKEHNYEAHAIIPNALTHMGLQRIFGKNLEMYDYDLTLYDGVGEQILSKLSTLNENTPWFCYIHIYDIHGQAIFNKNSIPDGFNDEKNGINRYERMISLMDVWLGKIIEKMDLENTLVIFTADHGSDLSRYDSEMDDYSLHNHELRKFEEGKIFKLSHVVATHLPHFLHIIRKKLAKTYLERRDKTVDSRLILELKKLNNTNLRPYMKRLTQNCIKVTTQLYDEKFCVPLIFCGQNVKNKRKINQQVRSVDIFPTILDLINLPHTTQIHGRSLYPFINGEEMNELPACVESASNSTTQSNSNTIGVRTSSHKYFRDKNDPKHNVHLYNLQDDPLEEKNISEQNPDLVFRMENSLQETLNNMSTNNKEINKLSNDEVDEAKDILRRLGYI
jgi:arylsulfatase A-like enzyme